MSRRWMCVLMLVCALVLVLVMPRAWAQWPPETHPTDQSRDIVMSWDRSTVPGDVVLWKPRTVLGFSHDLAFKYGQIHVVCGSASDSEFGRCPTESELNSLGGTTEITLRLVELRTGLRTEIRAVGSLQRVMSGPRCSLDYWDDRKRLLNSAFWFTCGMGSGADQPLGTGVEIILPQREISRLVAGHWKATMRLNIKADPAAAPVATATFNFDFTVTDYDAISIYFPGFDGIAPLVNMDLRYDPIRKVVGGYKEVDMCLYDGVGSQSEFLGVTVRDSGPRPPPGRDFAVWHGDGGSDDTQRLDYQVSLKYGGNRLAMKNGEEQLLRGIDSAQLRLVMLPGISQPVYCVPTPLVLETPPTPIASKRPGLYDGELTVELRVPTAKP
ncbi:CfaE/CblD family pilus tip adhesin [uncultured Stenotrophomonas sp.]|nr:CfaE/CblD family pilus tip adhesin [uncultured Stenotrophomonas sp.]